MNEFNKSNAIDDILFSLDIGTRNVVGTISQRIDDKYIVLDYEMVEHPERAMFDGQIHDIDKVSRVVKRIKDTLESRNDLRLSKVAIAAAGRALKTSKVTVARELDYTQVITKEIIDSIEMEGIQEAQKSIGTVQGKREIQYYCVGYSVMRYYLDDSVIINPDGHRGYELKIDIIATFLPHVVVDSLYTVVDRTGLEVINLTLEPIAAINVAIPENLRLLNLALVDVGAGTSDIAITKDGTIVSYGMVSIAGDAITEMLAREYLLDFNSAEVVKRSLMTMDEVSFTDVVGMTHNLKREEVLDKVEESITKITTEISEKILEFNAKPPSAVFCIGGGCQIPGFLEKLSLKLDLPKERIVIKGTESLQNIEFRKEPLSGPEYITPIGIGYTAFKERDNDFLQVTVNEKPIRLFNSRTLTVSDALVLVGFNPRSLIASRGESYDVTINGTSKKIYGEYGESAKVYVNGTLCNLDTKLKNKDSIYIENAILGKKRYPQLSELIEDKSIMFGSSEISLVQDITINGNLVDLSARIDEKDNIQYTRIETIEDLADRFEIDKSMATFYVNDIKADFDFQLRDGDMVDYDIITGFKEKPLMVESEKVIELVAGDRERVKEKVIIDEPGFKAVKEIGIKAVPKSSDVVYKYDLLVNGKNITIEKDRKIVFVDVFDYINFDTSKPKGMIDLKLNGQRAKYTDELKTGDVIEIGWR